MRYMMTVEPCFLVVSNELYLSFLQHSSDCNGKTCIISLNGFSQLRCCSQRFAVNAYKIPSLRRGPGPGP